MGEVRREQQLRRPWRDGWVWVAEVCVGTQGKGPRKAMEKQKRTRNVHVGMVARAHGLPSGGDKTGWVREPLRIHPDIRVCQESAKLREEMREGVK